MSLSRWNKYLGLYAYSSSVTEGVATDVWTLSASTFGRVDAVRARQSVLGGATETQIDGVVELSSFVNVPPNGIIVDGSALDAATAYRVRGVRPRPDRRCQYVDVEQIDRERIDAAALLLDGSFIADGSKVLAGV
jgi:hypothetical protein